jgi:hypothetical protein
MPDKNPNSRRWGGPGASHEDRTKPPPDPTVKDADDPDRFSKHSRHSSGGGETDRYHSHDPKMKHRRQAGDGERRHP